MSSNKSVIAFLAAALLANSAQAQTPGTFVQGAVLNADDLNRAFAGKQDFNNPLGIVSVPATSKALCLYGDSISANSDQAATPQYYAASGGGYGTWLNVYSNYRVYRAPQTNNFGVSGDTTTSMLARISNVTGAGCHIVVFQGGMNDIGSGSGAICNSTTANLKNIFTTLLNAGMTVIDTTIFPRSGSALWNATQTSTAICINNWRKEFARAQANRGYYLVDLNLSMTDPTSATWAALPNYLQSDGINPSVLGGSAMGYAIAQVINAMVPPWLTPVLTNSDTFDAVNNSRGNLLPNAAMTGTTGTINTCTGTAATGMAVTSSGFTGATGTCVLSVPTLSNNVKAQQIVLGGTMTAVQSMDITQSVATPGNIAGGDTVRGVIWVNTSTTITNVGALDAFMALTVGGTTTFHHAFQPGTIALPGNGFQPSYSFAGGNWVPLMTDSFTVTGAATSAYLDIHLGNAVAGAIAGTIQTCCWELRKVQP